MDNANQNIFGQKSNRYNDEIRKVAMWHYIRAGKSFYDFSSRNMNLPSLKAVQRDMIHYHGKMMECQLDFDGVAAAIKAYNFPPELSILEDGTKITEGVEFDASQNVLLGLVSPMKNTTGMPETHFFKAQSAHDIISSIQNNAKAKYVQVILVKPNAIGKKSNKKLNPYLSNKKNYFFIFKIIKFHKDLFCARILRHRQQIHL